MRGQHQEGPVTENNSLIYNMTFPDARFLQRYMARRVLAKNRREYVAALLGVVLCAMFLVIAIVVNTDPYRITSSFGFGLRYPFSFYLLLIFCLVAAILCLIPAVDLRLKTLRMQVSDNGPFLGSTKLLIEHDGLIVHRAMMTAKYLWAAFQGIEMAKHAVILPIDNGIGIIVPASAFKSDAERYQFVADVSKHLDAARV